MACEVCGVILGIDCWILWLWGSKYVIRVESFLLSEVMSDKWQDPSVNTGRDKPCSSQTKFNKGRQAINNSGRETMRVSHKRPTSVSPEPWICALGKRVNTSLKENYRQWRHKESKLQGSFQIKNNNLFYENILTSNLNLFPSENKSMTLKLLKWLVLYFCNIFLIMTMI